MNLRHAIALLVGASLFGAPRVARGAPPAAPRGGVLRELNDSVSRLVAKVSPAVVQVLVTGYRPVGVGTRPEGAVITRQHALGSGVIVDPSGYVLTNNHVVQGAQKILVVLPPPAARDTAPRADAVRRRMFEAKVVGGSPEYDLALLKIEATNLPTIRLGTGGGIRQGEIVFAVGSPDGLASTVTMGIVSSATREVDLATPMVLVQTDAPLNPGNSGGPLVDVEGELVGINTFLLTQSGGSEGLGFAIPVATARTVYEDLRKWGHVHRVEVGLAAQSITPPLASGLGLARDWGVVVSDVAPGSPAEAGGIEQGDVVDTVDGRPIDTLATFSSVLYLHRSAGPVAFEVLRAGKRVALKITPAEDPHRADALVDVVHPEKQLVRRLGIIGVDVDDRVRAILPKVRKPTGVAVAARTLDDTTLPLGLQVGDVIHAVNGSTVDGIDGLRRALDGVGADRALVLTVEREGRMLYVSSGLE